MVFSDVVFLFFFLPLVLSVDRMVGNVRGRNAWLLAASAAFYAFGEAAGIVVLATAVAIAWACGRQMRHGRRRTWLALGVTALVGQLLVFKYAAFAVDAVNQVAGSTLPLPDISLPLGISFFTFQAISYLVDSYRSPSRRPEAPLEVALYIALFPQLIAGPIVRFAFIQASLHRRAVDLSDLAIGARRFLLGLAKKVLIADVLGAEVAQIFELPSADRPMLLAWLAVVGFSLQIYFDFSGYSDMAIGLGRMFGFRFPENFNHPYRADSMTDFWRRWHMTLSSWFRDYVYIPLGGNRHGPWKTCRNLVLVFVLCGLWHGASWNFLAWGLLHGAFLSGERLLGQHFAWRPWKPLRHLYLLLVVGLSWVVFALEDFADIGAFFGDLAGLDGDIGVDAIALYVDGLFLAALAAGIAASLRWPLPPACRRLWQAHPVAAGVLADLAVLGLFATSAMAIAANTFSPFIYFRF